MPTTVKRVRRSRRKPPRAALADSIRGKYAWTSASSTQFAAEKRREIAGEGRRR